jgi:hypothetical protein
MQTINKKSMLLMAAMLAFSSLLFSFTPRPGGEHYRIYINKKLVVEQFVSNVARKETSLYLNQSNINDKIDVYYSHCGQNGTARHIKLVNQQNKVVKDIQFADVSGSNAMMTFNAKDILSLQNDKEAKNLQLYYYSKELPAGKLLAKIVKGSNVSVAKL